MRRLAPCAVLACAVLSCDEIVARRRSNAPLNSSTDFPCERYDDDTQANSVPEEGRCIVTGQGYEFVILVNVPESSFYAAGHTFVVPSLVRGVPNKDITVSGEGRRVKLPVVGNVTGAYTVTKKIVDRVGVQPTNGSQIPVKAVYTAIGDEAADYSPVLPVDVLFATSQVLDGDPPTVAYVRSVPAGRWILSLEPAPPFDEFFPPFIGEPPAIKRLGDQFHTADIGGAQGDFDDPTGQSRVTEVSRSEGLDGWTVWLRDNASGRRISTLKRPSGTTWTDRLDTIGRGTSLEGIGAVLAPPERSIALPTFVSELILTTGVNIRYPDLRRPVALEGIVAASADAGVFLSVASRITFDSVSITLPDGAEQPLLRYSATVSTDDRGRFATVLPPGKYRITVGPLEGTGFATFRTERVIEDNIPITLSPPRRTRVRGAALLTDGRPAVNAEVLATAEPLADTTAQSPPRPSRTTVRDDGTFSFDLDQGAYVITVVPEPGTGFPRVVTRTNIPADQADIGVIRVPPPRRLSLEIVEPTTLARRIPLANVRVFATAEGGGQAVYEIGNGMTDAAGKVEILLAQQPK